MKLAQRILCIFTLAVLGGCALGPQKLEPQPVVEGPIKAYGQGQPVALQVVDGRPSPTIGTRGGIYASTSALNVDKATLQPRLQAQAEAGLRLLGFTPNPAGQPRFTLTLREIRYQTPDSTYVTDATITAAFDVLIDNRGRRYTGRYSAKLDQSFGMAPNEATNSMLVSQVLSDALTRVFKDPSIGQALQ